MANETVFEDPPKYGLKIPLNHEFPSPSSQIIIPSAKQIIEFVPLSARYLRYHLGKKMNKKRPIMDYINMVSAQRMYGCPIGGIGGGTIGRGFKGEFCRFQLQPGLYEYITVPECQFIVNIRDADNKTLFLSVLSAYDKPKNAPKSWEWNLKGAECQYTGLYPRAWTTYDLSKYGIKLMCKQISPVIPHNYKDSSMPCAMFVWSAKNISNEQRQVSITFTWTEILPNKKKPTKIDIERYSQETTCGITLEQKIGDAPCTFTIAKAKSDIETIHEGYCMFNAAKTSSYVWECLKTHGKLEPEDNNEKPKRDGDKSEKTQYKKCYKPDSIGLSSVLSLEPGGLEETEFCLSWDMPVIKYKKDGKPHKRFYTKFFGSDGIAGASIASYAIRNYKMWDKQISEFQEPILNNSNIPDWLKGALMNEMYYVADGGTIWFDVQDEYPETDPRHSFGHFGYLEGHEYRMYNTYDVHFYASTALAQLWPNLQVVVQYMYRDTIALETEKSRTMLYDGKNTKYKVKNSIPHDLGDPYDQPFEHINCYNVHDVSSWRDLNVKFILQVLRDYRLLRSYSAPLARDRYNSLQFIDDVPAGTEDELYLRSTDQVSPTVPEVKPPPVVITERRPAGNILEMLYRNDEEVTAPSPDLPRERSVTWEARQYVEDMYDACVGLLRTCLAWDKDGDGLIENSGAPDQTYDAWTMMGPSAYCGGMWLAAVSGVRYMARLLEHKDDDAEFSALLEKAKNSFEEKLWTGSYYRFDMKPSNKRVVMSDQLAGQWFLRQSGLNEEVFPTSHVKKALRTIYENNVLKFCNGKMGAVNGWVLGENNQPGKVDYTAIQSEEVWTGVVYGLASLMIYEGMQEEAFATAGSLHNALMERGLSFETPEALYSNGHHRSIGYMRPLSIWGMYHAVTATPPPRSTTNEGIPNGVVHNGGQNGPVQNGRQNGPVQNGIQNGPVLNGAQNGPVQNGIQNGPVLNGAQNGPVQNGRQNGPVLNGAQNCPIHNGRQNVLVPNGLLNGPEQNRDAQYEIARHEVRVTGDQL